MKDSSPFSIKSLVIALLFVFACSWLGEALAQSGNTYGREQTQVTGTVQEGIVLQVSTKKAEASWQARSVGASLGTAAGYAIARNSSNSAAPIFGSILGGVFGERVASQVGSDEVQEIIVLVNSAGGTAATAVSIVQPAPFDPVTPGQAVLIVQMAGKVRIIAKQF